MLCIEKQAYFVVGCTLELVCIYFRYGSEKTISWCQINHRKDHLVFLLGPMCQLFHRRADTAASLSRKHTPRKKGKKIKTNLKKRNKNRETKKKTHIYYIKMEFYTNRSLPRPCTPLPYRPTQCINKPIQKTTMYQH